MYVNCAVTGSSPSNEGDVLDRMTHGEAVGIADNGLIPAVLLCWCVNHGLLDPEFAFVNESLITRVKLRDLNCREFFALAAAGELRKSQLNHAAIDFVTSIYGVFREFATKEAQSVPASEWAFYDVLARWLTARFVRGLRRKAWWRFWQRDADWRG